MLEKNWTLVVFTTLSQMVVGFFLIVICIQVSAGSSRLSAGSDYYLFMMVAMLLLLVIGVGSALIHLGKPSRALLAIRNLSTSWLSREMLSGLVFGVMAAVYVILLWIDPNLSGISSIVGMIAGVCGVLLVYCMSRLYMLRTVPVWNTGRTPLAFFITTLLLGMTAYGFFSAASCTIAYKNGSDCLPLAGRWALVGSSIIILLVVQFVLSAVNIASLRKSGGVASKSMAILVAGHLRLFWLRNLMAIGGLLFFISVPVFDLEGQMPTVVILLLSFGLILTSEVIGRHLFYACYTRVGI